jgi:hypothetical protein
MQCDMFDSQTLNIHGNGNNLWSIKNQLIDNAFFMQQSHSCGRMANSLFTTKNEMKLADSAVKQLLEIGARIAKKKWVEYKRKPEYMTLGS